jgi:hypothetical protein
VADTFARLLLLLLLPPNSALTSVDFPTLLRPSTATSGNLGGGSCWAA